MKNIFKSNLIVLRSGAPVSQAEEIMEQKGIRHLPIVNENNEICSLLSQRDIKNLENYQNYPVDIFSSSPVISVTENDSLSSVALKMVQEKVSSVILCNSSNEVIGIITSEDLLYHLAQILKEEELKSEMTSEKKAQKDWNQFLTLQTVGELAKRLSDIGI